MYVVKVVKDGVVVAEMRVAPGFSVLVETVVTVPQASQAPQQAVPPVPPAPGDQPKQVQVSPATSAVAEPESNGIRDVIAMREEVGSAIGGGSAPGATAERPASPERAPDSSAVAILNEEIKSVEAAVKSAKKEARIDEIMADIIG